MVDLLRDFAKSILHAVCAAVLLGLLGGCLPNACVETVPALSEVEIADGIDSVAWDVQVTSDGGYILAGYMREEGATVLRPLSAAYLLKTDGEFNREWSAQFGSDNNRLATAVRPAADGGYLAIGLRRGTFAFEHTINSADAIVVWKTDAAGNALWSQIVSEDWFTIGTFICLNTDESFAVAGMSGRSSGAMTAMLVEFDASGSELWRCFYEEGKVSNVDSAASVSGGGYVISGNANGRAYILRVDSDGNEVWRFNPAEGADHAGLFRVRDVIQTRDGGFAAVCDVYGGGAAVIKLDNGGIPVWRTAMPGEAVVVCNSVAELSDGCLVVAGVSSPTPFTLDLRFCARCLAIRLDEDGGVLWSGLVGADITSAAYGLTIGQGGYPVLAGYRRRENQDLDYLSIYMLEVAVE